MITQIQLNPKYKEKISLPSHFFNTAKCRKNVNFVGKPKWQWFPCDFVIMQILNGQVTLWSLQPNLNSQVVNQLKKNNLRMKINMEKDLNYEEQLRWNWHKSWIIPDISVNISLSENQNSIFYKNGYIRIMVVKPGTKNFENFFLTEVGIKGKSEIKPTLGENIFTGLKFNTTSYKNNGSKFNIIVALIIKQPNNLHPTVIDCRISSPIFVDSRKSTKQKIPNSINISQVLFDPSNFQKQLIKRKKQEQETIKNSEEGFYHYFSAPNIRNKIKDPFFLSFKFSNFLSLYYNSKITNLQELVKNYYNIKHSSNQNMCYSKTISKKNFQKSVEEPMLVLTFKANSFISYKNAKKQIIQKINLENNSFLTILSEDQILGQEYKLIGNKNDIKNLYQQFYYSKQKQSQKLDQKIEKLIKNQIGCKNQNRKQCGFKLINNVDDKFTIKSEMFQSQLQGFLNMKQMQLKNQILSSVSQNQTINPISYQFKNYLQTNEKVSNLKFFQYY